MKKTILDFLCILFISLIASFFAHPVFAHGGEPRLEISVERINPGGIVEVRGVDFDYEELISLSLTRSKIQIPLSEVTTDVEGIFIQTVVLPSDLPTGEYNFLARTDHHLVTSPTITVWGEAITDKEDNGIRDQSDVQFGAIPTFAPGIVSTPIPQTTAIEPPASQGNLNVLLYSVLLGVGTIALLGIRILNKR